MRPFPFGKALSSKLRDLARREKTLLPLVVLTVYVAAASRWCDQRDLVLTFASHGRHHRPELRGVVGFLANFLHMRIEVAESDSFLDLLRRVDREFHSACQHEDFDRVPDLIPGYSPPLYFNWMPASATRRAADERIESELKMQPFLIQPALNRAVDASSHKLMVLSSDTAAGVVMSVWYRPDLFSQGAIAGFGESLRAVAENGSERPSSRIASMRCSS